MADNPPGLIEVPVQVQVVMVPFCRALCHAIWEAVGARPTFCSEFRVPTIYEHTTVVSKPLESRLLLSSSSFHHLFISGALKIRALLGNGQKWSLNQSPSSPPCSLVLVQPSNSTLATSSCRSMQAEARRTLHSSRSCRPTHPGIGVDNVHMVFAKYVLYMMQLTMGRG
jgi:hypothetical protein